jgi:hypothetical protein
VQSSAIAAPVSNVLALIHTIVILAAPHHLQRLTIGMSATFLKRWTTWLLPLIVLRAFIPVGFMLSAGADGLALTFCPSIVQDAGAHDLDARVAAGQAGTDHSSHERAGKVPCPYGLVSAAASVELGDAVLAQLTTSESFSLPTAPILSRSPSHRLRIRGPPSNSPKALI